MTLAGFLDSWQSARRRGGGGVDPGEMDPREPLCRFGASDYEGKLRLALNGSASTSMSNSLVYQEGYRDEA